LEVDDQACPSSQTHGRNRRKTPPIARSKIGSKIPPKIMKMKILQHKIGDDLTQTHIYIDANQEFTRCGNHHNILPLFGGFDGSLTFSPLRSYTMKHTHTS
jgi:hypothetical protein